MTCHERVSRNSKVPKRQSPEVARSHVPKRPAPDVNMDVLAKLMDYMPSIFNTLKANITAYI